MDHSCLLWQWRFWAFRLPRTNINLNCIRLLSELPWARFRSDGHLFCQLWGFLDSCRTLARFFIPSIVWLPRLPWADICPGAILLLCRFHWIPWTHLSRDCVLSLWRSTWLWCPPSIVDVNHSLSWLGHPSIWLERPLANLRYSSIRRIPRTHICTTSLWFRHLPGTNISLYALLPGWHCQHYGSGPSISAWTLSPKTALRRECVCQLRFRLPGTDVNFRVSLSVGASLCRISGGISYCILLY